MNPPCRMAATRTSDCRAHTRTLKQQLCWRPLTLTPALTPTSVHSPIAIVLKPSPERFSDSAILYLGNRVGPHTNTPHSKKHKLERLLEAINPTVPTCAALCFYERKRAFQPDPFTSFQVTVVYFPLHHVEHLWNMFFFFSLVRKCFHACDAGCC